MEQARLLNVQAHVQSQIEHQMARMHEMRQRGPAGTREEELEQEVSPASQPTNQPTNHSWVLRSPQSPALAPLPL